MKITLGTITTHALRTPSDMKVALENELEYYESNLECEHITMSQLVEKTPWYQCENPKCRTIFYLRDVAGWKPSAFLNVLTEIVKAIKDKEEPKEKKK